MPSDLHKVEPRERAGSATNARYRFQTNLAIVELCDLLESQDDDFALLIEHLDDLVVIEKGISPNLTFIQVKARGSGKWTVNTLTKSEKAAPAPSSIIGKLYQNASTFRDDTKSLVFLSNAPFSVKLTSGQKCSVDATKVEAKSFHSSELKLISDALEPDFPAPRNPKCSDLLSLRRTDLSHTDQDTYTIGRLAKLLENRGIEGAAATALYKTIYHDLLEKAARTETFLSDEDLIKRKGIKRDDLSRIIQRAGAQRRFEHAKQLLVSDLEGLGFNSIQKARTLSACHKFIAGRAQANWIETQISTKAEELLASNPQLVDESSSLYDLGAKLSKQLETLLPFDSDLIRSGALVAATEHIYD